MMGDRRMTVNDCARYLAQHDNFILLTHIRPDGDTIGSAAALCHSLRRAGKNAYIFNSRDITSTYLPFSQPYLHPDGYVYDTVVAVDIAAENMFPEGFEGKADLSIDHHPSNSGFAGVNTLCMPEKASCGEIVLMVIEAMYGSIDREEADLLYVAVSTDTGCFLYGNTAADTHIAAAKLIEAGANIGVLNKQLFRTVSMARLKLEGMIYTGLTQYRDGLIVVAKITSDMMRMTGATEDDCDDLASIAGKVAGGRVSVTIRQIGENRSKISLRSGPDFNCTSVCARFGGGGHAMASGCTVNMMPDEAERQIVAAINEVWG